MTCAYETLIPKFNADKARSECLRLHRLLRHNGATNEIERLKTENEKLKGDIASIRNEASDLLSCHIETPNLAKDALRRMRSFIDGIGNDPEHVGKLQMWPNP